MCFAIFDWNEHISRWFLDLFKLLALFCFSRPWKMAEPFIWYLSPLHPKIFSVKFWLKFILWFWRRSRKWRQRQTTNKFRTEKLIWALKSGELNWVTQKSCSPTSYRWRNIFIWWSKVFFVEVLKYNAFNLLLINGLNPM